MTTPQMITITDTAPAVILDELGTAVLVEPGTYEIDAVADDLVIIDVHSIDDWYVAVHVEWLGEGSLSLRPKN